MAPQEFKHLPEGRHAVIHIRENNLKVDEQDFVRSHNPFATLRHLELITSHARLQDIYSVDSMITAEGIDGVNLNH